jgi:hypothetical protein
MKRKANKRPGLTRYVVFLVLLTISASLGAVYWAQVQEHAPPASYEDAEREGCLIHYSAPSCIDNKLVFGFYNPNMKQITKVSVHIPVKNGTAIFNVYEPLDANKTGTLVTVSCEHWNKNTPSTEWCCGNRCYFTLMDKPAKDVWVIKSP